MILFKTPHSKKFVSDRQAGLAWPCRFCGCASSSSFNNIVLQFLMHVQLAQSGMLGFHHYQLDSCVHTCISEKIPLPHFLGHFIIIIA